MALHLIKLCVGADSVEDLIDWQNRRVAEAQRAGRVPVTWHTTRMWPKREAELLDGGSLYWVVKGLVQCRQRLVGFEEERGADGIRRCMLLLDPEVVSTEIAPKRAFQGWRYLKPADAPRDAAQVFGDTPKALAAELAALGLL